MGIIGRLKKPRRWCAAVLATLPTAQQRGRASHARQYSDSDTYHKERRSLLSARYSADRHSLLCHWRQVQKIRKEDVSTMTLAAIKCRSILWCNFMINGTPSVSETRKPDKVRLRHGTGALIILISAPLGRGNLGVIVINCMQKATQKSMALNIFALKYDE